MDDAAMWRMLQVTDEVLDEMVKIIVETSDPEQVILFGSRAAGETGPESDVDFMVIESEPFGEENDHWDETTRLSLALLGFLVPIDVLVFSRDEIEYWRDSKNHVISRALRQGKVLYERP